MALNKLAKESGACMAAGGIVGTDRQSIVNRLKGRNQALDRAANYAQGGIVARAFQFKGKGGPTDDEIPVKVAGQNINVSNGEKAVVLPVKTANNPQAVTAIEDIIEQSNGKPTNRAGNNFAAGGMPETASGLARRVLGDTGVSLLKGAVAVPEAAVGVANIVSGGLAGKYAEQAGFRPKEAKAMLDEMYSPEQKAANQYVQEGDGFIDTIKRGIERPSVIGQSVAESLPSLPVAAARGIGAAGNAIQPAATTAAKNDVTDPFAYRGGVEYGKEMGPGPAAGIGNFKYQKKDGEYDPSLPTDAESNSPRSPVMAQHPVQYSSPTTAPAPGSLASRTIQQSDATKATPTLQESSSVAGLASQAKMPSGLQFDGKDISGQKLFTNVSDQAPLANVPASSPIPTVPGMSLSQRAINPNLGTADDNLRQIENMQKLSDMTPQGGFNALTDQNAIDNAEKTQRWREDDLIAKAGRNPAAGQLANTEAQGNSHIAAEGIRSQAIRDGIAANAANSIASQGLARRGQDIAAQRDSERNRIEEMRLAGNPLDNIEKQIGIGQKARLSALQDQVVNGKTDAEKLAAIKSLNSLSGRQEAKYKALTAGGGKNALGEVMPERVVVVDENTGRFINEGAPQAGDMLAEARAAIAKGADRAAVNARLKQAGIKVVL